MALAGAAAAQEERFDLRPRYRLGDRWEGEASLSLALDVRLVVPSAGLDRTSVQEQRVQRRFRDELTRVQDGRVAEVRRRYARDVQGTRDPGEHVLRRSVGPLHQRRVLLTIDEEGRTRARADGDTSFPKGAADAEVATERFEAVLPQEPVAVGERWEVAGDRLRHALGPGLGHQAAGKVTCALLEVREEALDEDTPPERYAFVELTLAASGRQGAGSDAPELRAELTGALRFSLERRRVVTVELSGTARLRQTRAEAGEVVELDGSGPLEVRKRYWFPARPQRR